MTEGSTRMLRIWADAPDHSWWRNSSFRQAHFFLLFVGEFRLANWSMPERQSPPKKIPTKMSQNA
jgi:hypothetical protein